MKNPFIHYLVVVLLLLFSFNAIAQSPGYIVRPAGGIGATPLNPDGDAYSSKTTSGFTTNDISESELPFKIVPPTIIEPTGDLATGPSGGFTDIVRTVDNSGFYIYKDATNIYFRLRIGGIISGSKGYSILIDTDGKIGNTGPAADANFIAPTNTGNGNPGFEYEVVLRTNFDITVFNVDGTANPVALSPVYPLNSNSQISVALSTDGNNPDYFYDWFVPLSAIGNPASIRMVATTVTSPSSALQGSRSDIYGIDDAANSNVANAWTAVVNAQPTISLTDFNALGNSIGATCTAAPVLSTPINMGINVIVSGTWTHMDASKSSAATITLFRNGVALSTTTTVNSGGAWSITVPTIANGDVFYAKAQVDGESMCLESNNYKAIGCSPATMSTTNGLTFDLACFNDKGMQGTRPSGAAVRLYSVTSSGTPILVADDATTTYKITYPSATTWRYDGQYSQGNNSPCSGGQSDIPNAQYMITATETGKCESARVNACMGLTSQTAPVISQTTLAANHTIVSGTVATAGSFVRLYINGIIAATTTASGTAYSFTNLSLSKGDLVEIRAQATGQCLSATASRTVACFTQAPLIDANTSGSIPATATSIAGKSAYSGAVVTLYKGVSPNGSLVKTAIVNSAGIWTITGLSLAAGETFYATQTIDGCTATSAPVTVSAVTTVCPSITGTYTENSTTAAGELSAAFTGTVRLYLDGVLIGSTNVTTATTWSIPSFLYKLYPGAQLTVTAQAGTASETSGCAAASAIVACAAPGIPQITTSATAINVGQTVTFSVNNPSTDTWYAVLDANGKSYATTVYKTNTANFSMTTNPITTAGTYDLRITADKLTGCAASFTTARITANHVTLPVRFVAVTVKSNNHLPEVSWKVTSEQNVKHYSVERSSDGSYFEEAGTVVYMSTSETVNLYSFTDAAMASEEVVYYRIKQVDHSGKYLYSKIVSLNRETGLSLQVLPNPAYDKTTVQVNSSRQQNGVLQLVNLAGAVVKEQKVTLKKGFNRMVLDGLQQYTKGTYFIKVTLAEGTLYKKIVIK